MTLTILDCEQRSDEWYEARRGIVTASTVGRLIVSTTPDPRTINCPACNANAGDPCVSRARNTPTEIASVHQVRTALAATLPPVLKVADNDTSRGLTLSLVAERITGRIEETYQSRDMLRGELDEPYARKAYAKWCAPTPYEDLQVDECGFMTRTFGSSILGYSPDGLVGEDGLIEIKSRRPKTQLETVLAGDVPADNMAQLQAALFVSGRQWIDYVSYAGGMNLYVLRVLPEKRWFAAIQAAVETFTANAAQMTFEYETAVEGLPMTEYVDHFAEIE